MSEAFEGDDVTLEAVLDRFRDALQEELHTALPGRVESYDAAAQTADVKPMIRRSLPRADGSRASEELPTIRAVPVVFPSAGNFYVRFPVAAGDEGLLLVCERDLARWRVTGEASAPVDVRAHHLAHATFLPGLRSRPHTLPAPSGTFVEIGKSGGVLDLVAKAQKVLDELTLLKNAFDSWTVVPNDGGAALKTLLTALTGVGAWPHSVAAADVKVT